MNPLQPILDRIPTHWGRSVSIGAGWYSIVLELNAKLAELLPDYEVHQVKEKFGGLRYYTGAVPSDIAEEWYLLIGQAELESQNTCEVCGKPGKQRGNGWIRTLCKEDYKSEDK